MKTFYLVQITDLHLSVSKPDQCINGVNPQESFRAVLQEAMHHTRPQYILLTGDLVHDDSEKSYTWLMNVMNDNGVPWSWLPGNHDALHWIEKSGRFIRKILCGSWRVIGLNSCVVGASRGALAWRELMLMARILREEPHQPTLLALHHALCPVGSSLDDGCVQSSVLHYLELHHRCVQGVFHGHIHQHFDEIKGRIRILGTPASCVQFLPRTDTFMLDPTQDPGYRWFALHTDGSWDTEVRRLSDSCFRPCSSLPNF